MQKSPFNVMQAKRIGRIHSSERSTGSLCIKKTIASLEEVRSNRKIVSCNRVRQSEVQPVHIPTRKNHNGISPQASSSHFQEISVSSPMQIAKDVTPPTTVQSGYDTNQVRRCTLYTILASQGEEEKDFQVFALEAET